ncbi:hypothetical protein C8J57DRAFT_1362125 [Mycena rebaudengoi]|nr:hypothetical protein C8J57DRAFT_1362125 [Mycena rebaudengoi]
MDESPSSPAAALATEKHASPMADEPLDRQFMNETVSSVVQAEMPAHAMSDEPRLVETLKECFANLTKGNESQTENSESSSRRIRTWCLTNMSPMNVPPSPPLRLVKKIGKPKKIPRAAWPSWESKLSAASADHQARGASGCVEYTKEGV